MASEAVTGAVAVFKGVFSFLFKRGLRFTDRMLR